jgi:hypothetical protein
MAGWISPVVLAEHMGEDVQSTDQGDDDDDDIGLSTDRPFSSAMGKLLSPERSSLLQLRGLYPAHAVTCVGSLHISTVATGYDTISL